MKRYGIVDEELVSIGLAAQDAEAAITQLGELLCLNGYVEPAYVGACLEREKEFPTGLPTAPYGVAIPHADGEHVLRSGIAVGVLSAPLHFHLMCSPEDTVPVRVVLLLAIRRQDNMVRILQQLATAIQDASVVQRLVRTKRASRITHILRSQLGPGSN